MKCFSFVIHHLFQISGHDHKKTAFFVEYLGLFFRRQGPGARTMLSGVAVAAAAAVTGVISDPREVFGMRDNNPE